MLIINNKINEIEKQSLIGLFSENKRLLRCDIKC